MQLYAQNMHKICYYMDFKCNIRREYAQNMKTYAKNIQCICTYMPKICIKYEKDMQT